MLSLIDFYSTKYYNDTKSVVKNKIWFHLVKKNIDTKFSINVLDN